MRSFAWFCISPGNLDGCLIRRQCGFAWLCIDLPKNQQSGLFKATRILKNIEGIAHIELDEEDVVRHRLVKAIIKAYEKDKIIEQGGA